MEERDLTTFNEVLKFSKIIEKSVEVSQRV
jgi:hypothetical protein